MGSKGEYAQTRPRNALPMVGLAATSLVLLSCAQRDFGEPYSSAKHAPDVEHHRDASSPDSAVVETSRLDTADAGSTVGPGQPDPCAQAEVTPRAWPLRRLTRLEYNNTVADLFDDKTEPANALPNEAVGNSFGNDAAAQAVSSLLAEQYGRVAEAVAGRVLENPAVLARYDTCWRTLDGESNQEEKCAAKLIASVAERMYRRPFAAAELSELMTLYQLGRTEGTKETGVKLVLEALLQGPDFLYRIEWGEVDDASPDRLRLSGYEMATRLSYLYTGSTPDQELVAAARGGRLATAEQIREQASSKR